MILPDVCQIPKLDIASFLRYHCYLPSSEFDPTVQKLPRDHTSERYPLLENRQIGALLLQNRRRTLGRT